MARNNGRFSDDPVIRVRNPDGSEVPLHEVDPSKKKPPEKTSDKKQ